jgi:hypothetical protein
MQEPHMFRIRQIVSIAALAVVPLALHAASLEPFHANCRIRAGEKAGKLRLEMEYGDCQDHKHCGTNDNDIAATRFTGVSVASLAQSGSQLAASLTAEAGTFTCTGTVVANELAGNAVFTPNPTFVSTMEKMGFTGYDSDKLMTYAILDVESGWARSLKDLGIHGIDTDNLIALRIFNIDPEYVHSMTALGYALPDADQLISMRVQGVNADEVGQIRALGYQPTLDQLVQIRIFKVTPDFIRRMQARGFKNLSIDKLVQIRIFNLAD